MKLTRSHLYRVCKNGWLQSSVGVKGALSGEMCHAEGITLAHGEVGDDEAITAVQVSPLL